MKADPQFSTSLEIMGAVAIVIGVVDPMEGSVLILAGSVAVTLAMWLQSRDTRKRAYWAATSAAIALGVMWLFLLSSVGGFGGTSKLSKWWGLLLLPYPLGWIAAIIGLVREVRHWREHRASTT